MVRSILLFITFFAAQGFSQANIHVGQDSARPIAGLYKNTQGTTLEITERGKLVTSLKMQVGKVSVPFEFFSRLRWNAKKELFYVEGSYSVFWKVKNQTWECTYSAFAQVDQYHDGRYVDFVISYAKSIPVPSFARECPGENPDQPQTSDTLEMERLAGQGAGDGPSTED